MEEIQKMYDDIVLRQQSWVYDKVTSIVRDHIEYNFNVQLMLDFTEKDNNEWDIDIITNY
jgi:hypothetical protein